jgi:DNA polymerase III delta prime subunit
MAQRDKVDTSPLTSLNAIKLSARQVAETFIPPAAFDSLMRSDNAILSGPRGSGKTTLLKMLQSEALEHWRHAKSEEARSAVRSVGIFVGTDRTWNEQLAMPGVGFDPIIRERIAWAAFGTHTFRSVVNAMTYRIRGAEDVPRSRAHLRAYIDPEAERDLAGSIAELMRYQRYPSSLSVLSRMLSDRLVDLGTVRRVLRSNGVVEVPAWADLDVITLVDSAVSIFNEASREPDQRWALLFDELELAPESLVQELLGALRGHQPRLIFKLSLAPANNVLTGLEGPNAAVPGQDYEHIPLTHARKTATLGFSRELVHETLIIQGLEPAPTVNDLLGAGDLDSGDDFAGPEAGELPRTRHRKNPYEIGSPLWLRMLSLAKKDETFRAYLIRNHMDLQRLERLTPSQRASRLRKIRNIVVVRDHFRNEYGRRRSRKSYALYSGADNVLSLPDGNPRVLIALARQLFAAIQGEGLEARVPAAAQGTAIEATLQRFLPLLEAQESVHVDGHRISLLEFVDEVGSALAKRVVELDFNDNVRLTFHVDQHLRPGIEELVRKGVNTGALVFVPEKDSDGRIRGDMLGKQFRLSHLLATKYGLPIHLTPSVGLSRLLPNSMTTMPRRRSGSGTRARKQQDGLFGEGVTDDRE